MKSGIYETTTTSGTGTVTLSSVTGRPRFDNFTTNLLVPYAMKDGNNREWGIGTVGASNTLARTVVLATLVSGTYDDTSATAITLSGGTVDVWCAPLGEMLPQGMVGVATNSSRKALYSSHQTLYPNTTLSLTADRLYIIPFKLDQSAEINGFLLDMNTNAASSKMRIGLYAIDATGQPIGPFAETGDIDTTVTAAVISGSITAMRLPPGWYGIGLICSGAIVAVAFGSGSFGAATPFGVEGTSTAMLPIQMYYKAITAGWTALPASPTGLTLLTAGVAAYPAVALKLV
jgi:hypothetical protein